MAAKKPDKKDAKPKQSGGGIMGLLPKILGALAITFAALLFAAAMDVGHFGLHDMIAPMAVVPVVLYLLLGMAHLFMGGGGSSADAPAGGGDMTESFADFQSKTASRFASIQNSLDAMAGRDYDSLLEENRSLKEQLEAIHEAAREKVDHEVELLREKNRELEEKIKQWAVQTVDNAVKGEEPVSAEVS